MQEEFLSAIEQICEEKGISKEKVIETIEMAIASAYKKDYGQKSQVIRAKFDEKSGNFDIFQVKLVVDESMLKSEEEIESEEAEIEEQREDENLQEGEFKKVRFNPERHIMIEEAKKKKKKIKPGEELWLPLESRKDFGRIAAQTAKQVIIQRIREAERETIFEEYKGREGEIVSGMVQRLERGLVWVDLGKTAGVLFSEEQIPGEFYRIGQRLRVLILEVQKDAKGPSILLSRSHPQIVAKLFSLEVPEIASESIEIKAVAREAGSRSKIAVFSNEEGIDPIGACVGQKGTRVQAVINELGGEKIDIIEWSEDPKKYISNSLAPAKVLGANVDKKEKTAKVQVPEDQLSLAIGKRGQNVRLAAKLTGWRIDIFAEEIKEPAKTKEIIEEAVEKPKKEKKVTKKKTVTKKKEAKKEKAEKKGVEKNEVEQKENAKSKKVN